MEICLNTLRLHVHTSCWIWSSLFPHIQKGDPLDFFPVQMERDEEKISFLPLLRPLHDGRVVVDIVFSQWRTLWCAECKLHNPRMELLLNGKGQVTAWKPGLLWWVDLGWPWGAHQTTLSLHFLNCTGDIKHNEKFMGWSKDKEITYQLLSQAKWDFSLETSV